jgi:hypothetical protein
VDGILALVLKLTGQFCSALNDEFEEHLPELLPLGVFLGWSNYWLKY